jgi:hypothetical protein
VPETIGTQNLDLEETIRVSPTPFADRLEVEISPESPFANGGTLIRLSDFSGKIILEKTFEGERTRLENLGSLPAGAYFLNVQNAEGNSRTFRVLK